MINYKSFLDLTFPYNSNIFGEDDIQFTIVNFPGGEYHVKLLSLNLNPKVQVYSRLSSAKDLIILGHAISALRYSGVQFIECFLPYIPGARQDRLEIRGETFGLEVYAQILNSYKIDRIVCFDPHSDVVNSITIPGLDIQKSVRWRKAFYRVVWTEMEKQFRTSPKKKAWCPPYIISPDVGASKKIEKYFLPVWEEKFKNPLRIVQCNKTRNPHTGAISGFEVFGDKLQGHSCIIVDDIIDGGGTFLGLAPVLKKHGAGKIYLVGSHGIFSKGFKELGSTFEHIYTTDSWRSDFSTAKNITPLSIKEYIQYI